MFHKTINIGRWLVEFYFGYDTDELQDRLYDFGASVKIMRDAMKITEENKPNTGFTFCNPIEHLALVAIGPTTSGAEFVDTLVHEIHHLAVGIASDLGIDLESETPAYIAGDSARELAQLICELGCEKCH